MTPRAIGQQPGEIRPEEKAMLSRLVNTLVSLELRLVRERAEDG
jgi:hypothetical protein